MNAPTAAQLLAAYNTAAATCGKPAVKRFSDRKTAERRTAEMIAAAAALVTAQAQAPKSAAANYVRGQCPKCGSTTDITCGQAKDRKSGQVVVNEHQAQCHSCGHEFNYETGKPIRRNASAGARAFGGAESWADPAVRAARVARHAVRFTGQRQGAREFRSVAHAFEQLGLPMSRHIAFRVQLKAAGRLEGFGGVWQII